MAFVGAWWARGARRAGSSPSALRSMSSARQRRRATPAMGNGRRGAEHRPQHRWQARQSGTDVDDAGGGADTPAPPLVVTSDPKTPPNAAPSSPPLPHGDADVHAGARRAWTAGGRRVSPELGAILLVYFVQGVQGLSRLALSFFLKDELALSPTQASALMGVTFLPWLVKPLYGFVSDSLPLFGRRRRSYLVLAGVLGAASWLTLSSAVSRPWQAIAAATVGSLGVALSDVVADSLVVERARAEGGGEAGNLQSLCWGSSALGSLLSAYFSGSLLEAIPPRRVFLLTAALPLLTAAVAFAIDEPRIPRAERPTLPQLPQRFRSKAASLWTAFRRRSVLLPTLFIFAWQATPSADTAFFYYCTNELGFRPELLGRVRLVSSLASLLGVGVYQQLLRDVPVKKVLIGSTLLSAPAGLTQLVLVSHVNRQWGLPDAWFALGDSALLTALGQLAFMPTLVLAARLCPPGVEGTLFAALMSVYNASGTLSMELGALLTRALGVTETDFARLPQLLVLCNLSTLLPLALANLLDVCDDGGDGDAPPPAAHQPAADGADGAAKSE